MRIAYVINSLEGGGAAAPVPAIVAVMRAAGAEVRLFALTPRDRRALPAMTAAGIDVRLREGGDRDHLAAWRWLDRQVAAFVPDLIWTSLTRATLIGQLVGGQRDIPVVSWQHAAFLKPANLALLRARRRASALWVADSDSVAGLTAARLGIDPPQLATWPIFAADPDAPVASAWLPGQPLQMGSLGRLHPVKGYDVLLAALARLSADGFAPPVPLHLSIAGEGAERARLEAMATQSFVTVALPGFVDRPRDFLASLHLYLQPSRSEGFCIAAHEAMQAGLPVIASAVGELPLTITAATGVVVPPGDEVALAAALARLLADPGRLAAIGAAGRTRVLDRFSADRFAAAGHATLERAAALIRPR